MGGKQSYYQVLGVTPDASEADIRAAFRRLARERHPDRFSGPERHQAELQFQAITEAFNVLVDPAARARYDESLSRPTVASRSMPRDLAKALLAKAIGAMKGGNAHQAGELLAEAVAHDPDNARARHLYGMYLTQQAGRLEEGLRQLDQAVKLDALNLKLLLDASRAFAKARMFARASRLASMAAELAPGDPTVESWLAQLEEGARRGEMPGGSRWRGGAGS